MIPGSEVCEPVGLQAALTPALLCFLRYWWVHCAEPWLWLGIPVPEHTRIIPLQPEAATLPHRLLSGPSRQLHRWERWRDSKCVCERARECERCPGQDSQYAPSWSWLTELKELLFFIFSVLYIRYKSSRGHSEIQIDKTVHANRTMLYRCSSTFCQMAGGGKFHESSGRGHPQCRWVCGCSACWKMHLWCVDRPWWSSQWVVSLSRLSFPMSCCGRIVLNADELRFLNSILTFVSFLSKWVRDR